jgi:Spy/CpxP family protein refolding chaperone
MRPVLGIVLCASLAMWIQGTASGAAARKAAKPVAEILTEQQDGMAHQCKLSEEQQKTLQDKFDMKRKALEAWQEANTAKLAAAEEAVKEAQKGTDEAAKRKANGDLRTLVQDREHATAEADKAILAVLTPEQHIVWAGYEMAQSTLARYRRAKLTDDQTAKITACCAIAAKDLAEFTGDDKKGKQGRNTVRKCLKWAIDNAILTPEQREKMPKPAARK